MMVGRWRIRDNGTDDGASDNGRLQLRHGAIRGDDRTPRGELSPLPSVPAKVWCRSIAERPRCGRIVPRRCGRRRPEVLEARGRGREKWFCGVCGSSIFARNDKHPEWIAVRMGTFDSDPGVRPSVRSWVGSAATWEPIPDTASRATSQAATARARGGQDPPRPNGTGSSNPRELPRPHLHLGRTLRCRRAGRPAPGGCAPLDDHARAAANAAGRACGSRPSTIQTRSATGPWRPARVPPRNGALTFPVAARFGCCCG